MENYSYLYDPIETWPPFKFSYPFANCQDEPRLIATTPEEADEILEIWEAGR